MAALLLLAGGFCYSRLDRGWNPYDEGTLAHAAERVLAGELPHRDFDDVYTGGQALLNAAGFHVFGADLITPRLLLFALYLVTIPAVYFLATRFLSPAAALTASALALAWNVPIYTAAMPSWYNLLLALLGTAALVRHGETGAVRWIFVAGIVAGMSCAMKITGLYFVAGALLYFLFVAQDEARGRGGAPPRLLQASAGHVLALTLFAVLVFALLRPRLTATEAVYFMLPVIMVVILLVRRELQLQAAGCCAATPYRQAAILLAGFALPLLALAAPYAASGSLTALLRGVFLTPFSRLGGFATRPPSPATLAAVLPLAAVLYLISRHGRVHSVLLVPLALLLAAALFLSNASPVFSVTFMSMRWVPILAVVVATLVLWPARPDRALPGASRPDRARQVLFLLTALTAIISLIQYPLAHPIYLWYVATFGVLVVAGIAGMRGTAPPFALALFALFYVTFTVQQVRRVPVTERLTIERTGLRVTAADKAQYERVVALLREHARGEYTYAGPDTPELYFLSGLHNPTRHLFEFLAQEGRVEVAIIDGIKRRGVNVIALNHGARFSHFSPDLVADLIRRFPEGERVGDLEVRWRQ